MTMIFKTFLLRLEAQKWPVRGAILALAALLWSSAAGAESAACGVPGKPACPLQGWMRSKLATALAHKDLAELARRLDEVARLNPEPKKWGNWSKLALDGARAAREGRASGVIASCARCHSVYRSEFLVTHRARRLP